MNAAVPISPMPGATMAYVNAGLVIVPFKLGTKGPKGPEAKGWQLRENCLTTIERASHHYGNMGLAHAYSGTCCLDIDDMTLAMSRFSGAGIDLSELWMAHDAVRLTSGQPNRGKLLYRTPVLLRTRSFKGDGIELRCATAEGLTVQDVLPPSIHPDTGKPYKWLGPGTFENIPTIPADLLAFWLTLTAPRISNGPNTPIGLDHADIQAKLDRINPADKEYDDWLAVGMALHHETSGANVGQQMWERWSFADGKNYRYNEERANFDGRYASFHLDRENPVTLRSLERLATVPVDMTPEYEALPPMADAPVPGCSFVQPEKPKFKIETPAEFAAIEYEDDYIDGVIPDAVNGVAMGQSGSGKTFTVMDMVFAMARGVRWRDRDTKPARVLYIAAEGAVGARKRLRAYAQHHGVALDSINVEFLGAAPDLTKADDVRGLIDSILARAAASGRVVAYTHIVIDTWSQVTPGADENNSRDMGAALKNVQTIHTATGARILFVAHMGKDITKGMRGWSGFKAAMDYEIEVSRKGNQRTLMVSKSRDGQDGISFDFHLQTVTLGRTSRGKPVVSCVVIHDMAAPKRRPVTPVQTAVLAAIELHFEASDGAWMSLEKVLQTYKKRRGSEKGCLQPKKDNSRSAVQRALLQLVAKSWLEEKDGNYRPFTSAVDL